MHDYGMYKHENLFVQDFCIHPYVYVHMSIHIDVYVWMCARILNECILRNIVFIMHDNRVVIIIHTTAVPILQYMYV